MPPKKKGGKKKKEVEPITDPKMLRLIGEHLEGSTLNLTLSFEVANGPVQVKVILSEMDCVHHLYRELWRWMDCPWGKEYIFITTLPKTEQNSFTLAFDGGKGLTDIGLKDGDSSTPPSPAPTTSNEEGLEHLRAENIKLKKDLSDKISSLETAKMMITSLESASGAQANDLRAKLKERNVSTRGALSPLFSTNWSVYYCVLMCTFAPLRFSIYILVQFFYTEGGTGCSQG